MKTVSVAVLGAGIAGLSVAALVTKIPHVSLKVFEKEEFAGGRVFSRELGHGIVADLGANIIDFQNEQQEMTVRHFLRGIHQDQSSTQSLRLLKQPFLLYDKGLRQGDYYKPRYCYEGGFNQLIDDLTASIKKESLVFGVSISKIERISKGWKLIGQSGEDHGQYDYLILALDGPAALNVLNASHLHQYPELMALLNQTQYTTQISSAFQLLNNPQFSCILFKNHPLTFMSSHQEKYQSSKNIVMIQMDERFSLDHFEKSDGEIGQKIREQVPEPMQEWIGACLAVKKWRPSLIRTKTPRSLQSFQHLSDHLLMAGDACQGSSRVAGAIESAIESFRLFVQQIPHL